MSGVFVDAQQFSKGEKSNESPFRKDERRAYMGAKVIVDIMSFGQSDKSVKKIVVRKLADEPAVVKIPKPKAELPVLTPEEQIKVDDEKH
uniref:Uncharacterized protein n=1 Tax=Panagrolaimus sp. JU765 TaxID=591449 RepID=A0AC34REU8_9BILA